MLTNSAVHPTLPAVDLKRARKFYEDKLGLKVVMDDPKTGLMFQAGEGTFIYLYQRGPTKADHTVAEFEVDDIESEVKDLRNKGIKFEEYNIPSMGIKTINGISTSSTADMGEMKAAWFKDTEGNILALNQMSRVMKEKFMGKVSAMA